MRRIFLAIGSSLLGFACARNTPPAVPQAPSAPHVSAPAAVYDVPAMSTFSVSLLNSLGTRLSSPGDPFRAKVISPLMTPRGDALVPIGALLKGRVVAVEQAPASRLRLKFDSLTTAAGPVSLDATLADVQPNPSFVVRQGLRSEGNYDVTLDGVPAVPVGGSGDPMTARSHSDIRLAPRTQLDVILVRPLHVGKN